MKAMSTNGPSPIPAATAGAISIQAGGRPRGAGFVPVVGRINGAAVAALMVSVSLDANKETDSRFR
jgi:hypothetical protein